MKHGDAVTNPFGPQGAPRRERFLPTDPVLARFTRRLRQLGATTEQIDETLAEWPNLDEATRAAITSADDATLRAALAGEDPLLDEGD